MIRNGSCFLLFLVLFLPAVAQKKGKRSKKAAAVTVVDTLRPGAIVPAGKMVTGNASVYDLDLDGSKTASGEDFFNVRLTAAHNTAPLNSWIKVSNPANGKYVLLRVNDRIPPRLARRGVIVRVSQEGARKLGIKKDVTFKVKVQSISVNNSLSVDTVATDTVQDASVTAGKDTLTPNTFEVIGKAVTGIASFYSYNLDGTKTSTGERYRNAKLTAASNNFKLNTWVLVTNLRNNKSVIVRINDHMHPRMKRKGRVVDMSREAARQLDYIDAGLTKVKVEPIRFVFSKEVKEELDSLHRNNSDSVLLKDSVAAEEVEEVFSPAAENYIIGAAGTYSAAADGSKTASGEIYRGNRMTGGSNDLDPGTRVRVSNLQNGKSVVIRINDGLQRSGTNKARIVDLSAAAAKKLGFPRKGNARVKMEVLDKSTLN